MTLWRVIALMLSASMVAGCNIVIGDRVPNEPLAYITNESEETIWVRMGELDGGFMQIDSGDRYPVCTRDSARGNFFVSDSDLASRDFVDEDLLVRMDANEFCASSWVWDGSELTPEGPP